MTLIRAYAKMEPNLYTYIGVKILDKQEYRLKTEEMLKLAKGRSFKEAMEIAESIDWKRVKNTALLGAVSEIYEANGEYQKGRDILLTAFERASDSKKIIYRLAILALKMGDVKEATECYEEFLAVAPKDPNKFVLKYRILKAKNASLDEQIEVLEDFKKAEYIEKWAFELAKLYHEAGRVSECLEECDDLILWFSEGKYIYKAMELKMQYKPLTPLQREKYENRFGAPVVAEPVVEEVPAAEPVAEPVVEAPVEEPVIEETPVEEPIIEEPTVEEVVESLAEEVPQATRPLGSIEEMVQEWQAQQKENAQMIQAKLEEVEAEKAAQQVEEVPEEESKDSILPDDIRKLMEELEAESADIDAQKIKPVEEALTEDEEEEEVVESKPLLKQVVEKLTAMEIIAPKEPVVEATPVAPAAPVVPVVKVEAPEVQMPEEEEPIFEQESFEKAMAEALEEIGDMEQKEGIKIGDTQSIALSTKALATAAKVEIPQEEVAPVVAPTITPTPAPAPVKNTVGYDTGFIVQGRYDLDVHSEIGLKAGLTEEQKKLFSYFVPVHGMSEQLVEVLQNDKNCKARYGTSRIGNVLVIGRKGSGKTVLAVDIVKAIQKARKMKQGKMAIVAASALNTKDVESIVAKLHGGALIVESAADLNSKTIDTLCEAMEGQTGELLVVLEDERKPLMKMLEVYPNFKKKFTSQIEIPVFINDELVTFGQTYAKENGYKIDEMGILALYSRIDMLQREEKAVTVADVKEVVDEAIDNANSASMKKLMKKVFGKHKDDADRVILTEEDFR